MSEQITDLPANGTELTRFNALKHGILSRYTVLPWEDAGAYDELVAALVAEHDPRGPTEEHLVEELAGILWRKRRLRLAEAAAHRRGLDDAFAPFRKTAQMALVHLGEADHDERTEDAVRATATSTAEDLHDVEEDEAMTRRALKLLGSSRNDAYEKGLAALREDTRGWWLNEVEQAGDAGDLDEDAIRPDAESLRRFVEREVMPWFEGRRREIENRPLVREQAFGDALNVHELERLGRYEVHLDRKLERTLAMLLKLKELRAGADEL